MTDVLLQIESKLFGEGDPFHLSSYTEWSLSVFELHTVVILKSGLHFFVSPFTRTRGTPSSLSERE